MKNLKDLKNVRCCFYHTCRDRYDRTVCDLGTGEAEIHHSKDH